MFSQFEPPSAISRRYCGSRLPLLTLLAVGVSHAALALPSGASVQSGFVSFTQVANRLAINQRSQYAIINWSSFSIGAAGTVQFNNGSGATLNRVTGSDVSTIDGILNATGSVYLVNPNGVIIGKSGVVNVGGTFVASTLNIENNNFKSGGALTFTGSSTATVINLGYIGAAGRDVVLMAYKVQNDGTISAPNGDIGLLAGSTILLRDMATDDGIFAVELGGAGSAVTNSGDLQAAMVELRANGGNVYALAGNATGFINATGVSTKDGKVFLTAGQGYTDAAGVITATQSDGLGGDVTTAGKTVGIASANITAGNWTLQQDDFTLTPQSAAALSANLATTSITIKTIGTDGGPSGGDIIIPVSLGWSSGNNLTLSAYRDVDIASGQTISNDGASSITLYNGGSITFAADNEGRGIGTVHFGAGAEVSTPGVVGIFYNPAGNDRNSVNAFSYISPTDYSGNVSAGTLATFMLVNTVYDLQNVQNNLAGDYALGRNIDAGVTAIWNGGEGFTPIGPVNNIPVQELVAGTGPGAVAGQVAETFYTPTPTPFTGELLGNGYIIKNLTINMPTAQYVGLFSDIGPEGSVVNVKLHGGSVTGADEVGSIAGQNDGTIYNARSDLLVTGVDYTGQGADGYDVGGLVGLNTGYISASRATGNVVGYGEVGGLAGANVAGPYQVGANPAAVSNAGIIEYSSASGSVIEGGGGDGGGLVGQSATSDYGDTSAPTPSLFNDHASGNVVGTGFDGGLAGDVNSGVVANSYATGSVAGAVTTTSFDGAFGGLIGFLGDIDTAMVTHSHASGSVSGAVGVGGLIGEVDDVGNNDGNHLGFDRISNVFSTGSVSASSYGGGGLIGFFGFGISNGDEPSLTNAYATGNVSGGGQLGGLIGSSSGTVTYSYWNTTTTGQSTDGAQATTPGDPTTGSIGLSGVQFRNTVRAIPGGF